MQALEFKNGTIQIDAAIIAQGLGISPALLLERLRAGQITSRCEKGIDADSGLYRLTFFSGNQRLRFVIDEVGTIIQRSAIDFGDRPLPDQTHKPGT